MGRHRGIDFFWGFWQAGREGKSNKERSKIASKIYLNFESILEAIFQQKVAQHAQFLFIFWKLLGILIALVSETSIYQKLHSRLDENTIFHNFSIKKCPKTLFGPKKR